MSPRDGADEEPVPARYDAGAEMALHGITRVPVDVFHYREYRYARLSDAVDQARRDANAAAADPG